MKIYIVRGAFLNPFELQNYYPLQRNFDIRAISSKYPISNKIDIPLTRLWSPTDLPAFPLKFPLLNRLFIDAHQLFGLEEIIRGADIVHVAETYYGYTHQAVMAKRRGLIKKIISTVWETIPFNNEGIRGRKQYKKMARENIDHFIAVTERAKAALLKEGVSPEKVSVVNMGVDIKRFKPSKNKLHQRNLQILCVSRLVQEKGVGDLLQAFLQIRTKYPNVSLVLVGHGPLKSDLLGYKNISIKTVPYTQLHNIYQKADIFCLPSRGTDTWEEQYGMALIEAMSSGLPIVTTNTGAIPEVCGPTAIYTDPSNINNLATNLEKLLYNENLRLHMGKEARDRATSRFSSQKASQKIAEIYKRVCR